MMRQETLDNWLKALNETWYQRQRERFGHQMSDAEYIRRCKQIDKLNGQEWAQ